MFSQDTCRILRCRKCGLVFRHPPPGRLEIERLYNRDQLLESPYFGSMKGNYDPRNPRIIAYEKELARLESITRPGNMLDLGCGYGVFLDLARDRGWIPYGVDISEKAALYARTSFDLEILAGTVAEAAFPTGYFRAVTMWDVVEHLADPLATLKETHRILESDGIVVILTINIDSLIGRLANLTSVTKDYLYDVHHVHFFSERTLHAMLRKAGFAETQTVATAGAQIQRWQSRKIPFVLEVGVHCLDVISRVLGGQYRQTVVARKQCSAHPCPP